MKIIRIKSIFNRKYSMYAYVIFRTKDKNSKRIKNKSVKRSTIIVIIISLFITGSPDGDIFTRLLAVKKEKVMF